MTTFRNLMLIVVPAALLTFLITPWMEFEPVPGPGWVPDEKVIEKLQPTIEQVNREFRTQWDQAKLRPSSQADSLAVIRRLSLSLTGSIPSLQEIREVEKQPEEERLIWWLAHLLTDRRYGDYMAERLARVYVGVENGPFLIYRRRRFVSWLSDQLMKNVSYGVIARDLIVAEGVWTTQPEANFITVTAQKNDPDEIRLAGRFTRAFLGMRMDCMQCHDDQLGDRWKQTDFHHLASFFAGARMSVTGVRNSEKPYEVKLHKKKDAEVIQPKVPFAHELYPKEGGHRDRLARWVTHSENPAFARAFVNRMWALMFGHPLVEPIDNIPLQGPYPPGLEVLAKDFSNHNYDIRRLIAIIALSEPFQRSSRDTEGKTIDYRHYEAYAAYPLTRLRPEQVAGGILQAASLKAIDAESHIFTRVIKYLQGNEFVQRYGDVGSDEFGVHGGTIPQRLLMMNGKMVSERTDDNLVMNAAAQLSIATEDTDKSIESAYLALLTRRPTEKERHHFSSILKNTQGKQRMRGMQDLYWSLLNSTEFSWNH
jgi:hypothetical protein